tara:strand:+ start:1027 stop:1221 length:195 start_codon:yes stop_codon:yes gene_type:complete
MSCVISFPFFTQKKFAQKKIFGFCSGYLPASSKYSVLEKIYTLAGIIAVCLILTGGLYGITTLF